MAKWAHSIIFIVISNFMLFVSTDLDPNINFNICKTKHNNRFGHVIHVSALFRHGDRTAIQPYPKDPYKNYTWPPDGYGMLTQVISLQAYTSCHIDVLGWHSHIDIIQQIEASISRQIDIDFSVDLVYRKGKQRAFKLGKWFRNRYSHLIQMITSHVNISMRSTNKDRTIMSAQCLLAALYPSHANNTIYKNLLWHPVPVHTVPRKYDNTISQGKKCPLGDELMDKIFAGKKMKKIYDKYAETFCYLEKHSGYEFSKQDMKNTTKRFDRLFDTLKIQQEHGMKLPSWTKKVSGQEIFAIENDILRALFQHKYEYKLHRLKRGPLLELITDGMKARVNKTSPVIFRLYSTHDNIISDLMILLGIYNNITPPYSAALIFEVREKQREKFVTVLYANSTISEAHFLEIPRCKSPCTFEKFLQVTNRFIPSNWDKECEV